VKTLAAGPGLRPGAYGRGQASVEFALAGVAFLLLLFAIMEMALAVLAYNTISFAASEAVRYGSAVQAANQNTASTNTAIQNVAIAAAPDLNLTSGNVAVTWSTDSLITSRNDIAVTISYNYPLSIPFLKATTLPLTSTSKMMASQ